MSDLRNKVIRLAHENPELRGHLLPLLKEAGKRITLYRGMTLTMNSARDAGLVRRTAKKMDFNRSATDLVLKKLQEGSAGSSWSLTERIATVFATWKGAHTKGKKVHVIFEAQVDPDAGYDPQRAGEELAVFYDESEVRIPPGTPIKVMGIRVFYKTDDYGKYQFGPILGRDVMLKA